MSTVDLVIESKLSNSLRARQVCAMFDAPPSEKCHLEWHGDVPIDSEPWNVGLIVGPSGSGKSSVARALFGANVDTPMVWNKPSVIDDFADTKSVEEITQALAAVGFNTVPAWLRPYDVLSNGEKFRVGVARRMLELPDPIVIDEFTSVVDRQVAQIGSHAVQKFVRKANRKLVAVTCHYDVIDWLQPDWILEPATMKFTRRLLRQRPAVDVEIRRVERSMWSLFAPFHYLTNELHTAARCFVLFIDGRPAAFSGFINFPHPRVKDIRPLSRTVTLPDYQGLGLVFILNDALAARYKALGLRVRCYPAHASFIRAYDKSPVWRKVKEQGTYASNASGVASHSRRDNIRYRGPYDMASRVGARAIGKARPCATFEYCGAAWPNREEADALINGPVVF